MIKTNKEKIKTEFYLLKFSRIEDVERHVKMCEGGHVQQVVYSSNRKSLTQVCFTCGKVVTNLKK